MAKAKTPSYILELELNVNPHERKHLNKKLEAGRQIYNACLGEALKRLHVLQRDKEYRKTVELIQNMKTSEFGADQSERKRLRALAVEIEQSHGYSEYQLHSFVKDCQQHFLAPKVINGSGKSRQGFLIGSLEAQKLATRAFQAVEKVHYHKAEKVHFKRMDEPVSVENKCNTSGLRWKDGYVLWGELKLSVRLKRGDVFAQKAIQDKTKYIRVLKRTIRSRERFFVQLIQEGVPPQKKRQQGDDTVGLDIGPGTVAIVSDEQVSLRELAPNVSGEEKKLRRVERAMDRSRRANNPDNYDANGVPKSHCTWKTSRRYRKLKARRKEIHRKLAAKRKQSHEMLANEVLSLGSNIKVETMRFQALQKRAKNTTRNQKNGRVNRKKRFGKSIARHAPAMFLSILERKLAYEGKALNLVNTTAVKASQFNHVTEEYHKKQLGDRWNVIEEHRIQRDLYSAFLLRHVKEDLCSIDVQLCKQSWDSFLRLHDMEIQRIQAGKSKTLHWYIH